MALSWSGYLIWPDVLKYGNIGCWYADSSVIYSWVHLVGQLGGRGCVVVSYAL